ncbi:hypothetical protein HHL19_18995 [Streptomyces sp. R302]|uniref:hypothetical protein n=1 Tax=unclassified Streptomyces TaxID=2593676 RepID=UPI00145F9296|nr:hypothetical protein [Streptomyces sp. R301]NML80698.1 hypothetical protein [Streptomyces sp. R302]
MNIKKVVVTALALVGLSMTSVAPAQASTGQENQYSYEACKTQAESPYKFALYYNSGYAGAWRNIAYSVYDFAHEPIGGQSQGDLRQPLEYCPWGAGANQEIKNNAASAKNKHSTYYAVVYYNSGYKGNADWIGWQNSWSKLINTYNENASFAWRSA